MEPITNLDDYRQPIDDGEVQFVTDIETTQDAPTHEALIAGMAARTMELADSMHRADPENSDENRGEYKDLVKEVKKASVAAVTPEQALLADYDPRNSQHISAVSALAAARRQRAIDESIAAAIKAAA